MLITYVNNIMLFIMKKYDIRYIKRIFKHIIINIITLHNYIIHFDCNKKWRYTESLAILNRCIYTRIPNAIQIRPHNS